LNDLQLMAPSAALGQDYVHVHLSLARTHASRRALDAAQSSLSLPSVSPLTRPPVELAFDCHLL